MRNQAILLLISMLFLCGCTQEPTETTSVTKTSFTTEATTEVTTEPTETTAEPTTAPTTEPDLSIHVAAGAHKSTYTDPDTGDYLDYYLFVPENAVKDMPLIIYLHGDGNVGNVDSLAENTLATNAREIYGEEFPFILLTPSTRVRSWINGTIPETLMGLIQAVAAECEIDIEHVIITGHSRGSIGVWHMVSAYGDYFSAAVPVSCGNETKLNVENCCKVPFLCFAGNGDKNEVKYGNAMKRNAELITEAGGDAEFILLDGKNHVEVPVEAYTRETFEWMLTQ